MTNQNIFIAVLSEIYINVQAKHEATGKYGLSHVEMSLWIEQFQKRVKEGGRLTTKRERRHTGPSCFQAKQRLRMRQVFVVIR